MSFKFDNTLALTLTNDNQYIRSWVTDRKSLKAKFLRTSSNGSIVISKESHGVDKECNLLPTTRDRDVPTEKMLTNRSA